MRFQLKETNIGGEELITQVFTLTVREHVGWGLVILYGKYFMATQCDAVPFFSKKMYYFFFKCAAEGDGWLSGGD